MVLVPKNSASRSYYNASGSISSEMSVMFIMDGLPGHWGDIQHATLILQSDVKELLVLQANNVILSGAEQVRLNDGTHHYHPGGMVPQPDPYTWGGGGSYPSVYYSMGPPASYSLDNFYKGATKVKYVLSGNVSDQRLIVPKVGFDDTGNIRKSE